jgi:oligopeptide transport system substrate-binding protein
MWQAVGVRASLTNVEFSMLNRKVRTRDYQVARWFYIASFNDAYAFLQLFLQSNPNNWPGVKSDEYDELLQLSNLETDVGARQLLLEQAELVLMEQYPLLPISFYVGRRLISPRVKGWVDSPGGPTPSRYLWLE